jgi:hypothetical protein
MVDEEGDRIGKDGWNGDVVDGIPSRILLGPFSAVVAIAAAVEQRNWSCSLWSRRGSKNKNKKQQLARIGRGGVGDYWFKLP